MIGRIHIALTNDLSLVSTNLYLISKSPVICFNGQQIIDEFAAIITLLQKETLLLSLEIAIEVAKVSAALNEPSIEAQPKELLSKREKDVLKMMFDGLTNKEIAQKLFISFETVKSHRKNILLKTGSKNTAALTKNLGTAVIEELKR